MRSRPHWACEVLSASNALNDLGIKLAAGRGETVRAEPFEELPLLVDDLFGGA